MRIFIQKLQNIMQNDITYRISLLLIYFVFCFLLIKIFNYILKILEEKTKRIKHCLDFALIDSLKKAIKISIILFGIYEIFNIFYKNAIFLSKVKILFEISILFWLCFDFISKYAERLIEIKEQKKENINYGSIGFFKKISQILIFLIITFISLGKLGIDLGALLAIGGIGGMAIGLAAKDMLSNVFGGLTIYLDKPFEIKDWISSPDKNIEGTVEEIGWRQTKIMTFTGYPIYVANSIFSSIIIENKNRAKARRIRELIPIKYLDTIKIEKIIKNIKEMLKIHPNINQRMTMIICLESISIGVLNIRISTFVNTIDIIKFMEIQQEILLKIMNIIKINGGELALSTKEIFINDSGKIEENKLIISNESNDYF